MLYKENVITKIFLLISIGLLYFSVENSPKHKFDHKSIFIAPPPNLEYFSFGFQMPAADMLWIRALQDFDYCENLIEINLCEGNGWLAQVLDSITNLAPDYQVAYRAGGLALTVLVSDYPGASKIFDKGVKLFPKDQPLLYRAAYHAMIEEKNNEKAAKLFIQSAENGGPEWQYSLASRLYTENGRQDAAEALYQQMKTQGISEGILKRMREKIDQTK